jgi:hypothetical protein
MIELLEEARTSKQAAEEHVARLRDELKNAHLLTEKAAAETSILRQQIQVCCVTFI